MLNTLRKIIKTNISDNSVKYLFLLLSLGTGIIAGAIFVSALPPEKSTELMNMINQFCKSISSQEIELLSIFEFSLIQNIKILAILLACSLSIYMIPVIFITIGARGFVIGFTIGFMTLNFGFKGFLMSGVSIFPQLLIALPTFMLMSVIAINRASKHKMAFTKRENKKENTIYIYIMLSIFLLLVISSIIDSFVVPVFIKMISGLFLQ